MKPKEKEQLREQKRLSAGTPPRFRNIPLVTPKLGSTQAPAYLRATVTRNEPNPQDYNATLALLDHYRQGDLFKCPRCPLITHSVDEFVEHITEEINKAMTALQTSPEPKKQP